MTCLITVRGALAAMGALTLVVALGACTEPAPASSSSPADSPLDERLDALDDAVAAWAAASTVDEAWAAAEAARNLVVGPDGPLYGDADGDGVIAGDAEEGLLPGLDGEPGLADPTTSCAEADVLGGRWDEPAERWDIMLTAIDEWTPDGNTFPSLPSHPQRVVGWATLTLEADSLDLAHEYAGHARLHVDVTRAAYESC